MMMHLLISSVLFFSFGQGIKMNISVADGDKLAGVVEIRVTVQAESTINQVEFYVNGSLRATDSSTPYTYRLDTLVEKEGPLELEVGVFLSDGASKRQKLNLIVDNGIGLGAQHHTENAQKFLTASKWDEAIQACRVALKADENYAPAMVAMSRAYRGKGMLDRAQQWAEDALLHQESIEVLDLLSAIHVERAFSIISFSGDEGDPLKEISNALKAAVSNAKAAMDLRIKSLGAVSDQNRFLMADLLMRKNDYSAARRILMEKWSDLAPELAVGNRLVYANMRSGRMEEAYRILQVLEKKSSPNAATYALLACGSAYYRNFEQAADALKKAGFDDPDSPTLITASAYVASMQNERSAMSSQINRMIQLDIVAAETYYYLYMLQYRTGLFSESRDNFRKCILHDPLLVDAYVERGYQALLNATREGAPTGKERDLLLNQAETYFEIARNAKEDSPEALNGLALTYMYMNKNADAERMASAAASAGPEYPWSHFTYSAALKLMNKVQEAQKQVEAAGKLDKRVLEGRAIPVKEDAWNYTARFARQPVVIPPR